MYTLGGIMGIAAIANALVRPLPKRNVVNLDPSALKPVTETTPKDKKE